MHLLLALAIAAAPAAATPTPAELHFGAQLRPDGVVTVTAPQVVFLEREGTDTPAWTATVDRDWLRLSAMRGTAPSMVLVQVPPPVVARAGSRDEGHVTFTLGEGAAATTRTIRVTLEVMADGRPPVGSFDAPADGTVVRGGALRLSGWALDDIDLAAVEICRDPPPRSPPGRGCGGALQPLGVASIYDAARPDVAAQFPSAPRGDRSAWTYVLDAGALPRAERGTFRLYAMARDVDGHATLLGIRFVTVDAADTFGALVKGPAARALAPVLIAGLVVQAWLWSRRRRLPERLADADGASPAPVGPFEAVAVAAIVAVAALIRLPAMRAGLTYDELYTFQHFVGGRSLWDAATAVGVFNNHIAYSLLAGIAVRALGSAEWVLRLPSLLLGAAAVYCLWRFVRDFAGRDAGLLAALFLAVLPMHVEWSRYARGYTGLAVMAVVSSHRFFRLLRNPSPRDAVVHALATVGGLYFHLYGVWIAAIQYVLFGWVTLRGTVSAGSFRLLWRSFTAIAVLSIVLYAPVAAGLFEVGSARGRTPVQTGFPQALFEALTGAQAAWLRVLVAVILVAGFTQLRRHALHLSYFIVLLIVPFTVVWLGLRPLDLYPRFFEYWAPILCAILAVAVAGVPAFIFRGRRAISVIAASALALPLLIGWVGRDLQPAPAAGYRESLMQASSRPITRAFVVGPDADMLAYYLPRPAGEIASVEALERVMRQPPYDLTIAYHDTPWNAPEHQRIAELLSHRCRSSSNGAVRMFRCGIIPAIQ